MINHKDSKARTDPWLRFQVRPKWFIISAACLLVGLILSLAFTNPAAYHRWHYNRLMSAMKSPSTLDRIEEHILGPAPSRIEQHLESLADAGVIDRLDFRIDRYVHSTTELEAEIHSIWKEHGRPAALDSSCSTIPPGFLDLHVWCEPHHSDAWLAFVAHLDVTHDADKNPQR